MSAREERAENYVNGENGMAPLSWGRLKIARKAGVEEIDDDEMPDVAAALYLMPFQKLRTLTRGNFLPECEKFANGLEVPRVVQCAQALGRDMAAIRDSEIVSPGKPTTGEDPEPNPSQNPSLSPPGSE